jgi:hypothetical protein
LRLSFPRIGGYVTGDGPGTEAGPASMKGPCMSKRLPPSKRPGYAPQRTVKIGIMPGPPVQVGVAIATGSESPTVIAPDEARTMAARDSDPRIADLLRHYASKAERVVAEDPKGPALRGVEIIAPKITGAEALGWWVNRHAAGFQACYREATRGIWPADVLLWVMPRTESLDDPPIGVDLRRIQDARTFVSRNLPILRGSLDDPPRHGYFYVIASRGEGRFKGSLVAMLPIPTADDDLPPAFTIPDYSPENN